MHTEGHILTQYCSGRILVETGTCYGRTVEFALAHGAKSVRSVEGYRERYESCVEKFTGDSRVSLWCGHSKDKLSEMIKDLSEPVLFFLDAHPSGPNSYGHDELEENLGYVYGQDAVLVAELNIIANHHINDHIIIVDDQHSHDGGIKAQQKYKDILLSANPNYSFRFEKKAGHLTAGCLIAEIIKEQ
jgi:hypothetical protein